MYLYSLTSEYWTHWKPETSENQINFSVLIFPLISAHSVLPNTWSSKFRLVLWRFLDRCHANLLLKTEQCKTPAAKYDRLQVALSIFDNVPNKLNLGLSKYNETKSFVNNAVSSILRWNWCSIKIITHA